MGMHYRRYWLAWLVVCLLALPAQANPLRLGALNLPVPADWQRADVLEEQDLDSVILRSGVNDQVMEMFLPVQRIRLKTDREAFLLQLEKGWRKRYGDKLVLNWIEAGGETWRMCRRPSRIGKGQIFQLVTVHESEAYQLIVAVPDGVDQLPDTVREMLEGAYWDGKKAPLVDAAVKVENPIPAETIDVPAHLHQAAVEIMPSQNLRLLRKVLALPGSRAWGPLAKEESGRLARSGLITGLGLTPESVGVRGFLEGYQWLEHVDEVEEPQKQAFRREWRVQWSSVPKYWETRDALELEVTVNAHTSGSLSESDVIVSMEMHPICAPRKDVVLWLNELEQAGPARMNGLARLICRQVNGVVQRVEVKVNADEFASDKSTPIRKKISLPVPEHWRLWLQTGSGEIAQRLVILSGIRMSEAGNAPGDALFRNVAAVYVYGQ